MHILISAFDLIYKYIKVMYSIMPIGRIKVKFLILLILFLLVPQEQEWKAPTLQY